MNIHWHDQAVFKTPLQQKGNGQLVSFEGKHEIPPQSRMNPRTRSPIGMHQFLQIGSMSDQVQLFS